MTTSNNASIYRSYWGESNTIRRYWATAPSATK